MLNFFSVCLPMYLSNTCHFQWGYYYDVHLECCCLSRIQRHNAERRISWTFVLLCMLDARPTNAGHSVTTYAHSWSPQPSAPAHATGTATAWVYEFPMFPIIQAWTLNQYNNYIHDLYIYTCFHSTIYTNASCIHMHAHKRAHTRLMSS